MAITLQFDDERLQEVKEVLELLNSLGREEYQRRYV